MEIERINDNTVKFYLSYIDIEERGFTREEVWYNRDKSEELFWEMMDEINDETEFEVEGPLWIQVHAMNNGIEVTVTRAQMENNEIDFGVDESDKHFDPDPSLFTNPEQLMNELNDEPVVWTSDMFVFDDFENLIPLAKKIPAYAVQSSLYSFENKFYMHVIYDESEMDDDAKLDYCSIVSEYGSLSQVTIHRLEEYGKVIMESDVLKTVDKYFGE
ncbi:adaptor protein MecA [Sporosarcina thermotolerans]|uniref:Adapter protein MecA n=1 Tax=Sporosarcina thermotolerans TaxID=633404 RepID=A0AAW9A9H2_9BACL|nr:adaptor protein MecA [Sporosarcina thermotolerans]MDW0117015.1 adaptor protein MecA [Sporosarcina thermotolerans]WHT47881.1 adaptor protein MecA [Sporosarcina thermotolerans]